VLAGGHSFPRYPTAPDESLTPRHFPLRIPHDCGLVINPNGLGNTIEGNIVQGTSRSRWEEVMFDRGNVTKRRAPFTPDQVKAGQV
jgi:hypothetical protein